MANGQEPTIDSDASAMQMADTIFGDGVTILSASCSGDRNASGNCNSISPKVTPLDRAAVLTATVIPTTGHPSIKATLFLEEYRKFSGKVLGPFPEIDAKMHLGDGSEARVDPKPCESGKMRRLAQ